MTDIRTGIGWDNHRISPGRPLILAGVRIESEIGLEGHSDADVLSHAITDAILEVPLRHGLEPREPRQRPSYPGGVHRVG